MGSVMGISSSRADSRSADSLLFENRNRVPRLSDATRVQYPVQTVVSSDSQLVFHSTPYLSGKPSFSDQKLKFKEEIRKIQFRTDLFKGSEALYGSEGQMCSGWVRQVRGE